MRLLRTSAAVVAFAMTTACAGLPNAERQPHQTYSAAAFFQTTSLSLAHPAGHAFSADGARILISSDASGVFNAQALPGAGGEPQALTASSADATFAISFFPNDDRVLFNADKGGNELDHIYVRAIDGQVRDLTPGQNLKADFVGWSADGKTFWVTTNERDAKMFDVYAYDAASYERRLVFQNPGFEIGDMSSDGRWLALVQPRTSADSNLFLVDLASADKTPRLITQHTGNISHGVFD